MVGWIWLNLSCRILKPFGLVLVLSSRSKYEIDELLELLPGVKQTPLEEGNYDAEPFTFTIPEGAAAAKL